MQERTAVEAKAFLPAPSSASARSKSRVIITGSPAGCAVPPPRAHRAGGTVFALGKRPRGRSLRKLKGESLLALWASREKQQNLRLDLHHGGRREPPGRNEQCRRCPACWHPPAASEPGTRASLAEDHLGRNPHCRPVLVSLALSQK